MTGKGEENTSIITFLFAECYINSIEKARQKLRSLNLNDNETEQENQFNPHLSLIFFF